MSVPARWKHQEEAFQFVKALFLRKFYGGMLAMAMGCVAGDASIAVNRGGNSRRYTLRDLYRKFHGGETVFANQARWSPDIECRTASLIDGQLHLNRIINVLHRGTRPVLKIQLASGKSIRVTADHEIACPNGIWKRAALLGPGMEVLTNGQPVCRNCGSADHICLSPSAKYRGLCKKCCYRQRPKRLPPLLSANNVPVCRNCGSARQIAIGRCAKHRGLCMTCIYKQRPKPGWTKEKVIDKDGYVRLYNRWDHPRHNKAGQVYEHIIVMEEFLGRPITQEEHVHHKDRIRRHNNPENLEVLPGPGHSWRHGKEGGYLHLDSAPKVCFTPRIDTVVSVTPDGESDVYDLQMADPGHNFVANGVIVHNCGKSRVACDLAASEDARQLLIVCPLRVIDVWRGQIARFAPQYHFVGLGEDAGDSASKTAEARRLYLWSQTYGKPTAICINYDSARIAPFANWAAATPWDMVIADECVPEGTQIATPQGDKSIEELKPGDIVLGYDHAQQRVVETTIAATFRGWNNQPRVSVGPVVMTSEHPVWTENRGYTPASQLKEGDHVTYRNEDQTLRVVRLGSGANQNYPLQILQSELLYPMVASRPAQTNRELRMVRLQVPERARQPEILRPEMLREMENIAPRICGTVYRTHANGTHASGIPRLDEGASSETGCSTEASGPPCLESQSREEPGKSPEGNGDLAGVGVSPADRRQWSGANDTAANALPGASGLRNGIPGSDWMQTGLPESGSCASDDSLGNRGGRPQPPSIEGQAAGSKEGRDSRPARMDRYSVLELANPQPSVICGDFDPNRYRVFNIETGTGNYFANGLLVHNCHRMKDPRGRTSLFMAKLGLMARRRLALTGTPMPHEPTDIWAQFRFLNPFYLDHTFFEFKLKYAVMGGYFNKQVVDWRNLDDLEKRFREVAYRVDDSVLDLPPEMDETRTARLSAHGQRIYRQMEDKMIAWINESEIITAANCLVKFLRLSQITSGWASDEAGRLVQTDHAKEDLLEDVLADLKEPAVVFCRFRSDLEAVHRVAARLALGSLELSGQKDELQSWQKQPGWPYILAVQIQAGGVGVDLTRARVAIYFSCGYSLTDYLQSRARLRRPPQTRPCLFIHLAIRDSIDESVLRAIQARRDLIDSVLHEFKRSPELCSR